MIYTQGGKKMKHPKPLKKNDKVAVIAPSSPTDREKVDRAEKSIKKMGLKPVMFPSCYEAHGHLAGTDEIRAKDINEAFLSPDIRGIFCLKGGTGSTRLLPLLDYEAIGKNPKVFLGYSDITALHVAFNRICKMITYHGPMGISDVFDLQQNGGEFEPYTYNLLKKNLFETEPLGEIQNPSGEKIGILHGGIDQGRLIGGNLSLVSYTLGSKYEINPKGKILFLEDVDEPVYKIDNMLMSLKLSGKLAEARGIILGTFSRCNPEEKTSYKGRDLELLEVFKEILLPLQKPIIFNFRAGHNHPNITFPLGAKVKLDANQGKVWFLEAGNAAE